MKSLEPIILAIITSVTILGSLSIVASCDQQVQKARYETMKGGQ